MDCPYCDKEYKTERWLKSHIKNKHPEEFAQENQPERAFNFPDFSETVFARTIKEARQKLHKILKGR